MGTQEVRPAFYALRPGGWRDYVTVLHLPYTIWNASYVALGAALAPHFHVDRWLLATAAFVLALGVSAHAFDELNGRPLRTQIGDGVLWALAVASLAGALAIGVYAALEWTRWLLVLVAIGGFVVPAYNLELFGGRFHNEWWLACAWGGLPVLSAYLVESGTVRMPAVLAAAFATTMILVQRTLSTPVRHARRTLGTTAGVEPMERALRLLPWANVFLGGAAVVARLTNLGT